MSLCLPLLQCIVFSFQQKSGCRSSYFFPLTKPFVRWSNHVVINSPLVWDSVGTHLTSVWPRQSKTGLHFIFWQSRRTTRRTTGGKYHGGFLCPMDHNEHFSRVSSQNIHFIIVFIIISWMKLTLYECWAMGEGRRWPNIQGERQMAWQKSSQSKDQSRVLILQPTEIAEGPGEEREDRKGEEGR